MADDGGWFPAMPDELWRGATAARRGRIGGTSLFVPTQIRMGDHEPLSEPAKIDPVAMVDQWFSDTFPGSVVAHDTLVCGSRHDPNPLIDAVEQAIAPSPATAIQNLGLLAIVQHPYITGKVKTDEGVLGDQANALVPVEILCV